MNTPSSFFILAGEASGDSLGAEVMKACISSGDSEVRWFGMGGAKMHALGLESNEDFTQLSIVGIGAAIQALSRLNKLADRLIAKILAERPETVFTIDSKGFSIRFAKKLRKAVKSTSYQPKIIHMVAPTVWAWGGWRARAFERYFDAILCLFPFEPAYFDSAKVNAISVGHPLAWKISANSPPSDFPQIAVLPGSRVSEIENLLPVFLQAAREVQEQVPSAQFVLPTLSMVASRIIPILDEFKDVQIDLRTSEEGASEQWQDCHLICAASGTVTLEAALAAMPGVTAYHLSMLNRIFTRLFYKPNTPILPDILLNSSYYPYHLSPHLNAELVAHSMMQCIDNYTLRRQELEHASNTLRDMLTVNQPSFQDSLKTALKPLIYP